MKKIVHKQLYTYFTRYELLHRQQSGFRSGHSCDTALLKLTDSCLNEMDKGNFTSALFLDFRKTFEIGIYQILLSKFRLYQCDDHSIKWFNSYLSGRCQKVKIGSEELDFKPIHSGVPQGFILGPLLFITFINDLPLVLQNVYADLYVDDTTLHKSSSSVSVVNVELNTDLYNVVEWCRENNMVLNTERKKNLC